jgi:hypothetical protein
MDGGRGRRIAYDPRALEQATAGLETKPLMIEHRPVTADAHPRQSVVGTVSNVSYEDGTVYGDLTIWDRLGIDAVESGELGSLSCGYRYRLDPTPGQTPSGEEFDGRMVDINMNHVSLVSVPRVADAVVADAARDWFDIGRAISNGETKVNQIVKAIKAKYRTPAAAMAQLGLDAGLLRTCKRKDEGDPKERLLAYLRDLGVQEADLKKIEAMLSGEPDQDDGRRADGDPRDLPDQYETEDEAEIPAPVKEAQRSADLVANRGPLDRFGSRLRAAGVEADSDTGPGANLRRVARALLGKTGPIMSKKPDEPAAMDAAAAEASFRARFPNAPASTRSGVAYCQDANGNSQFRTRQPIATDSRATASFYERFPQAKRFAR